MKRDKFKVRRLFIFGAGASHGATVGRSTVDRIAPLDKDFCNKIDDLNTQRPQWVNEAREYVLKEWKDHSKFSDQGLEHAIQKQISHLEFIDAIHPRRRRSSVDPKTYLNQLSHLICFVLRKCLEKKGGPYLKMINKVVGSTKDASKVQDRFITFNYDDLLDTHLLNHFDITEVYFDNLKRSKAESKKRQRIFNDPLLVKLHGSINWRCSQTDFENLIGSLSNSTGSFEIPKIWFAKSGTPTPKENSSPLIMPPLPIKPITHIKLFCFLWTKAYEYLHEAEELIICGYSLPEADRLAQSLFSGFTNQKIKKITVVDPNPGILSKWRNLLRRKNVNSRCEWVYFENFDEFADRFAA